MRADRHNARAGAAAAAYWLTWSPWRLLLAVAVIVALSIAGAAIRGALGADGRGLEPAGPGGVVLEELPEGWQEWEPVVAEHMPYEGAGQ